MAKKAKKAKPAKSTGLAVRPKKQAAPVVRIEDPKGLMQAPVGQLGELATVGALGLAELKLTAEEETILSEPVDPSLIQFKPAKREGPATIPYLPHIVYTRWFNRAFGRTGWSIVPTAAPKKVDQLVLVPYLLYIHGIPVAAAMGEQEFIEANKQQTYGDVIESTVASALRRCAKRLGVGLELWDKDWLRQHAAPKERARQQGGRQSWPDDVRQEREEAGQPVIDAEPVSDGAINAAEQKRLWQIVERAGRSVPDVTLWLRKRYKVKATKDIQRSDYAEIIRMIEARGVLPLPGDGE